VDDGEQQVGGFHGWFFPVPGEIYLLRTCTENDAAVKHGWQRHRRPLSVAGTIARDYHDVMTRLTRPIQSMPESVRKALSERGLTAAYEARPDYQRNDYLGWIGRAKRDDTKLKRLNQMLDELACGDVYMNMKWGGRE